MKVLFATSEIAPWVKTGGLGDVASALPAALRQAGADVRVLVPAYPALRQAFPDARWLATLPALAPGLPPARLLAAQGPEFPLWLVDCPSLYDRPGNPYIDASQQDWGDNGIRFGLLSRLAATLGQAWSPLEWKPDVVHLNDWQTALAATYLHWEGGAPSVLTVHNIAFQGCFGYEMLHRLGLPAEAWRFDGVEYHGLLSFLKAGLQTATMLTTVSPTYAREITTEDFGYGLAPLLRYRADRLVGIVNGVDTGQWNPATDKTLAAPYDRDRLDAKARNKAALQRTMGLRPSLKEPLFGVISRLTQQKGLDLVVELGERLARLPAQLAVLGSGDAVLEDAFRALAARHPGRVAVRIGFDEALAHGIEAGADIFLMPSRFEPCGLNQLYSLAYGTPPVVRATGGLADTVIDCPAAGPLPAEATGFVFAEPTTDALWQAIVRAHERWHDRTAWQQLQRQGMAADYSWRTPARRYLELYEQTLNAPLRKARHAS